MFLDIVALKGIGKQQNFIYSQEVGSRMYVVFVFII